MSLRFPVLDPVYSVLDQVQGQRRGVQPIVSIAILSEVSVITPNIRSN